MTPTLLPTPEDLAAVLDEALTVALGDRDPGTPAVDAGPLLEARIGIRGDRPTELRVAASEATARCVAAAWFGIDAGACGSQDALDAMAELANVVGGAIKPFLDGDHLLGLPVVASASELADLDPDGVSATIEHPVGILLAELRPA